MQLKIQRSQRAGGVTRGKVFFCLDVRADYSFEEQSNIRKCGLDDGHLWCRRARHQTPRYSDEFADLAFEAAGQFPKRIRLSQNRVVWLPSEVEEWLDERIAKRNAFVDH